MKQFTEEQLYTLKQWEDRFMTAIAANYYRNIGSKPLETMKKIYEDASGSEYPVNFSCGHCILAFLKEVGTKYYEDFDAFREQHTKEVAAQINAIAKGVQKEPEPKPVKKATTKKSNKKATNKK